MACAVVRLLVKSILEASAERAKNVAAFRADRVEAGLGPNDRALYERVGGDVDLRVNSLEPPVRLEEGFDEVGLAVRLVGVA